MKLSCYLIVLTGLIGSACASGTGPVTSTPAPPAKPALHIDLAKYRPKFQVAEAGTNTAAKPAVVPTQHINNQLHPLLDSVAAQNCKILYAQGYRILVYSGNERKEAMDVRKAVTQRLPETEEFFTYQQPTFRLKVGNYLSRLEARTDMNRLSDIAPKAMIVSEQVIINKPKGRD